MSVESWEAALPGARFVPPGVVAGGAATVPSTPRTSPASGRCTRCDTETGERRQVTDHPVGLLDGAPTLDGDGVLWFQDETGDESGRWLVQPFHGGETQPFLDGVPHGWNDGLAQAPGIVAAAISDRDGFAVYVSLDGGPATRAPSLGRVRAARRRRRRRLPARRALGDGTLLCIEHAEHGDLIHPALRVRRSADRARRWENSSTKEWRSTRSAGPRSPAINGSRSSTSARVTTRPRSGTSSTGERH